MSSILDLLPIFLLLTLLTIIAWVGYQTYLYTTQLANRSRDHLAKQNITFSATSPGLKIGVKELKTEDYADRTQSLLVNAWNLSTWDGYKSRLWGNGGTKGGAKVK